MPRVGKLRKLLVSLDIGQQNAVVIFTVKLVLFQGSVKNYWTIFLRIRYKQSNLQFSWQFQSWWIGSRWYINKIYCKKYKEIYTSQVNPMFFQCFEWELEGGIKIFRLPITRLLLGFVRYFGSYCLTSKVESWYTSSTL